MNAQVRPLERHRPGALGLEVDVLLTADLARALDHDVAPIPGRVDVANLEGDRSIDDLTPSEGLPRLGDRRPLVELDPDQVPCLPGLLRTLGHHQGDRVAAEVHPAFGQERLVLNDRPDLVLARHVLGGEHRHDSRRGARGVQIQTLDLAVGHRRAKDRGMEQARRRPHVVDVFRLPPGMGRSVQVLHRGSPRKSAAASRSGKSRVKWATSSWRVKRRL